MGSYVKILWVIAVLCAPAHSAPQPADNPDSSLAASLQKSPPEAWDALLDAASLPELEAAFSTRQPPPAWWGRLGLRLVRHYRHVGRPSAAERTAEQALTVPGPHHAQIQAVLQSIRIKASGQNIGVLAPFSGKFGAAGRVTLDAVKLALEGTPYTVVTFDTEGLESKAIEGVRSLVLEGRVSAIIGPVGQKESMAAALEAERQQVPIICLTRRPGIPRTGTFVFRHRLTTARSVRAVIGYASDHLAVREIATLSPRSPYGEEALDAIWQVARRSNIQIMGAQQYSPNATRFDEAIKGLIGRAILDGRQPDPHWQSLNRKSKDPALHVAPIVDFDALYIADSGKRLRLLLPFLSYWDIELRSLSAAEAADLPHKYAGEPPRQVYILGGPGFATSGFTRLPIKQAVGALFGDIFWRDTTPGRRFEDAWVGRFKRRPSSLSAHAYAAARHLADTMKKSGTRTDVQRALMTPHESIFGPVKIASDGDFLMPVRVLTISPSSEVVPAALPRSSENEDLPR